MWMPPLPALATMRDSLAFARACAGDLNARRLFRATVVSGVLVVAALGALSGLSCWAVRGGPAVVVARAAAPAADLKPDPTPSVGLGPGACMIQTAVREHAGCQAMPPGDARRRRALEAVGLLRAGAMVADPQTLAEVDVLRLRAALEQLAEPGVQAAQNNDFASWQ
jgi:hypothetical protein